MEMAEKLTDSTQSNNKPSSLTESIRLSILTVTDQLWRHMKFWYRSDPREFLLLCIALAKGIDFAIANNDVPPRSQELPPLLKQVYHRKSELQIQAAVMVLMISVKNACKHGWFLVQDADELLTLANEMARNFCSPTDINIEPSSLPHVLSNVTSRFFPRMKIGNVLASLEVKPGFGAFAVDFHIMKDKSAPAQEKIRLFVIQTDHTSTSSCLVNPPKVNFLLNGKGVEGRIDSAMETGPQYPTDVTIHLKYGTNLLQAVGQFNGNFIIAIAFVAMITNSGVPALEDHVQPVAVTSESDSEIIEGSSRISLNCPISFKRIKTPVKGQLCKHPQCFDYENYIQINSRRPSWRCPHCNQSVCYLDIRIDQNIVKVLQEVGGNISDIIISADGSWKPVTDSDKKKDEHQEKNLRNEPSATSPQSSNSATLVDLTVENPEDDPMDTCGTLERKPSVNFLPLNSSGTFLRPPQEINTGEINQDSTSRIEDDFWSGIYFPGPSTGSSTLGISVPSSTNGIITPVLTDAISPSFNREIVDPRGSNQQVRSSLSQTQAYSPSNMQLQPSQFGCPVIHEYGQQIPRNVTRTPIAVQALPAQSSGAPPLNREPFSRSVSDMSSSSMLQYSMPQNWDHQGRACMPLQQPQIVGLPVPVSSQGPSLQRSMSMVHQNTRQPPTMQSSHNRVINTGHHSGPVARSLPAVPVQLQATRSGSGTGPGSSFPMSTDGRMNMGPVNEQPDQNWRPTGRMRGSLQGRAYSDALNQFLIQPTHSSPIDIHGMMGNNVSSQMGNNISSQMGSDVNSQLQHAHQAYTDRMGTRQ
ncbi:hypothetical protein ACHQM5_000392 [Ranunculus cassubicifolius]